MWKKIILLLVLLWPLTVPAAAQQSTGLIFEGKIEEIASKTALTVAGATEKYLALKLDSKPKLDIRITARDAARFGLIDTAEPPAVIPPGRIKGLGWKVKLTCDKKPVFGGEPIYLVTNLERLD